MPDEASEPDQLDVMIAQLRAKMEKLQRAVDALEALRGDDLGVPMGGTSNTTTTTTTTTPIDTTSSIFRAMSIADAAILLLKRRDKPLKNPVIARELKAGGLMGGRLTSAVRVWEEMLGAALGEEGL